MSLSNALDSETLAWSRLGMLELVDVCNMLGINSKGNKKELINRITSDPAHRNYSYVTKLKLYQITDRLVMKIAKMYGYPLQQGYDVNSLRETISRDVYNNQITIDQLNYYIEAGERKQMIVGDNYHCVDLAQLENLKTFTKVKVTGEVDFVGRNGGVNIIISGNNTSVRVEHKHQPGENSQYLQQKLGGVPMGTNIIVYGRVTRDGKILVIVPDYVCKK